MTHSRRTMHCASIEKLWDKMEQSWPLSFQTTLVSRPKSSESNTKVERGTSVSPLSGQNLPSTSATVTSFEYDIFFLHTIRQQFGYVALPVQTHLGRYGSGHIRHLRHYSQPRRWPVRTCPGRSTPPRQNAASTISACSRSTSAYCYPHRQAVNSD